MPNIFDSFMRGQQAGMAHRQFQQQQQDRDSLRQLAPQVIAGDPAAYSQAAAISPEAAGSYADAGDAPYRKLRNAVQLVDRAKSTGNPVALKAALTQISPYIQQLTGKPGPTEWTPDMEPGWEQLKMRIAMADASQSAGGNVQSTYVDDQGRRVAIMRDGSVQVLGNNAPNNQIIDTGNGFYGVNKGNLSAAPVMVGGQQQPNQAMQAEDGSQIAFRTVTGPDGKQYRIEAGNPEAEQAFAAEMGAGGPVANVQFPDMVVGGQQLRSEPKAQPQVSTLTPQEVSALGLPAGTVAQRGENGAINVVSKPEAPSAADRKDALARRAKIPQLRAAISGMDRIEQALGKLNGAFVDTGPLDAKVQRYTQEGQELEAAVGAIQNHLLSLTRVPGIGSQSDLEARIAMLQYPSLDKAPEVNRRTLQQLRAFLADLADAYKVASQSDSQPAQQPAASGGGWSIQEVK